MTFSETGGMIALGLFLLLFAVLGVHNFNEWRECKAAGGAYVQVVEFGNGYTCIETK